MRDSIEDAREVALRALEHRRRTRRELEKRLRERRFAPEVVQATLDRLEEVGLVDDLEYARVYLRERLAKRAVGERVVRQQLAARGVGSEQIDRAFEEIHAESGESEEGAGERGRAEKAVRQMLPRYRGLEPDVRRRRLSAAMARRGFEYGLITELLQDLESETVE